MLQMAGWTRINRIVVDSSRKVYIYNTYIHTHRHMRGVCIESRCGRCPLAADTDRGRSPRAAAAAIYDITGTAHSEAVCCCCWCLGGHAARVYYRGNARRDESLVCSASVVYIHTHVCVRIYTYEIVYK